MSRYCFGPSTSLNCGELRYSVCLMNDYSREHVVQLSLVWWVLASSRVSTGSEQVMSRPPPVLPASVWLYICMSLKHATFNYHICAIVYFFF